MGCMILILIAVILMIILIFYYAIKNTPTNEVDFIIIGAGISGSFCLNRLRKYFPDSKILCLEADGRTGGRLLSKKIPDLINKTDTSNSINQAELGGMRYFPELHTHTEKLVRQLGEKTIQVPYIEPNNIGYFKGKHLRIHQFDKLRSIYNYPEIGSPSSIIINLLDAFDGEVEKTILDNRLITNTTFHNLMRQVVSKQLLEADQYSSGYNFIHENINFAVGVIEHIVLSQHFKTPQLFLYNGYESLVNGLLKDINLRKEIPSLGQSRLWLNSKADSFDIGPQNKIHVKSNGQIIQTKNLIIAIPPDKIKSLYLWDDNMMDNLDNLLIYRAFKIFLNYEYNWWHELGLVSGRSVTDLPIRQVWYLNENTLAIYCDQSDADYWYLYETNINAYDTWHSVEKYPSMVSDITKQLKSMHNLESIPDPKIIMFHFWDNASGFWAKGNIAEINQEITNPLPNVYITGTDISYVQGWVEGALRQSEFVLAKFGIDSIIADDG